MNLEYTENSIIVEGKEFTLDFIQRSILHEKIKNRNLVILTMVWIGGRAFDGCYEKRIFPKEQAEKIKNNISGAYIYFGEIAGKHSEIYGNLESSEVNIIDNSEIVLEFLLSKPSGVDFDHSFLDSIQNRKLDYGDEYLPNISLEELNDLFKYNLNF